MTGPKLMQADEYIILRDVEANGRIRIPLERKPIRVATLLNEEAFILSGGVLLHNQNVFLEDRIHDWDWSDGKFSYYTRIFPRADVLLVYSWKQET